MPHEVGRNNLVAPEPTPRSPLLGGTTFNGEKVLTEVVFVDKIQTVFEGYNCGTATGISPLETLPENS